MSVRLLRLARKFKSSESGVSALEFALIAPVIFGLLAAVVDFGMIVQTRGNMESAISTAMSYALAKGQDVEAANATSYTATIADIAAAQLGENTAIDVTLNRTLITQRGAGGDGQTGTASAFNICYCPERDDTGIAWGDSVSCSATCPDGGYAGRFLAIKAVRTYQPLFLDYGMVSDGRVVIESLAGVQ